MRPQASPQDPTGEQTGIMATTATSELFIWSGTDKNGRQTKGEINASSQAMARAQLFEQDSSFNERTIKVG